MYSCVSLRSTWAPNQNEWCWSGWWSAGPSSLYWFDNVTSRLCGYSESNEFSTRWWSLAITPRVHAHKNTHTLPVCCFVLLASVFKANEVSVSVWIDWWMKGCTHSAWKYTQGIKNHHPLSSFSVYLLLIFFSLYNIQRIWKHVQAWSSKKKNKNNFVLYYTNY